MFNQPSARFIDEWLARMKKEEEEERKRLEEKEAIKRSNIVK